MGFLKTLINGNVPSCSSRALEERGLGFRVQISNRHGIQDSDFKQGGIQDSDFSLPVCCAFKICDSNFRALLWDSYFKVAGIQDSNFKWVGFRIQIMSSGALVLKRGTVMTDSKSPTEKLSS